MGIHGLSPAARTSTMTLSESGAGAYRWGFRLEVVVAHHAKARPDAVAVRQGGQAMTYGSMVARARRVKASLRDQGVVRGAVVAVDLGRCPELVVAILGILGAGATYTVIDPHWPSARKRHAVEAASCAIVVNHDVFHKLLGTDSVDSELDLDVDAVGDGTDAAAIFYTSGSTGLPKGIRSPHRGPIRTLVGHDDLPLDSATVFLQAAPLPWDGLSLEMWGALLNGGEVRLLSRSSTVDAATITSLIESGVNTLWLTSSLFNVLAETAAEALSRLRLLMVGGERVSGPHVASVLACGGQVRIVNGYGPAETTIFATTRVLEAADTADVPIGMAVPHTQLLVVDPETGSIGARHGELWIGGDGLALGYLDPCDGDEQFIEVDGERYYRSGDLVRRSGETLWFEGRIDDQVKVRGVRIDPAHVEKALGALPEISSCHVTVTEAEPEDRHLVCLYTTHSGLPLLTGELNPKAAQELILSMVPDRWLHVDRLPLTAYGKIDRVAIRDQVAKSAVVQRADMPENDIRLLCTIAEDPSLTEDDDIVAHVSSSLQIVRLAGHLSSLWDRPVTVTDIYRCRTLNTLRSLHESKRVTGNDDGAGNERPTPAELRFWLAEQLDPGACDNMLVLAYVLDIPGIEDLLAESVQQIIDWNVGLRTVYVDDGDLPEIRLVDASEVEVTRLHVDETDAEKAARTHAAACWDRPFALDQEPPIRVSILTLGDNRVLLHLHLHHIAFDGWSEMLFVQQLVGCLSGEGVASQPISGSGRLARTSRERDAAASYWRRVMETLPPPVLPVPSTMNEAQRLEMSSMLAPSLVATLSGAMATAGVHPATVGVASVVGAVADRLGCDALSIGTAVPQRFDAQSQSVVGYFVNPLAITVTGLRSASAAELTRAIASDLAVAERHGFIPFEDVAALGYRSDGRHPVFQLWSVLQHAKISHSVGQRGHLRPIRIAAPRTAIELMVEIVPGDDGWEVVTFWRHDGISQADGQAIHLLVLKRLADAPVALGSSASS